MREFGNECDRIERTSLSLSLSLADRPVDQISVSAAFTRNAVC